MDKNIAKFIEFILDNYDKKIIDNSVIIYTPNSDIQMMMARKGDFTQTALKKAKAIVIEIPDIAGMSKAKASALIGLAVGRRLERFERGRKANATRTPNSRKEIAQNAIQARWNAK